MAAQLVASGGCECGWPAHGSGLETGSIVTLCRDEESSDPSRNRRDCGWSMPNARGRDSLGAAARLDNIRGDYSDWQLISVTSPDGESFTIWWGK